MAEELSGEGVSLQELFSRGMAVQKKLESDLLNPSSDDGNASLLDGMRCLEQATRLVNQLSLFSKNEGLEDITTANLKFLLLPVLLGDLTMQAMGDNRLDNIQKARVYFVDYLQRSKSYSITSEEIPSDQVDIAGAAEAPPTSRSNFEKLSAERTAKIQRFKEQKELEKKLKELSAQVEAASSHGADDEMVRGHTLTLLKLWTIRCHDNIESIDREVPMLREMERRRGLKAEASGGEVSPPREKKPWKPIVITREMLQAQVYGAGYPSLPTMSVEEFYEQKYKQELAARSPEGGEVVKKMRDLSMVGGGRDEEDGGAGEEEKKEEEEDSEEALKKAREWDDFKDDNRRGWGNKKNMG